MTDGVQELLVPAQQALGAGDARKATSLLVIPAGRARSNHADVARTIGIDIISGRYPEGAKLPGDAELTLLFAISRPVLRESVKTLVAKGLLTTTTRIGTVVCPASAWNMFDPDVLAWHLDAGVDQRFLRDLADIRLAVEPHAAALAALRRTEHDLAELNRSLTRMRGVAYNMDGFAEADLALHLAVATASANPFMRSIGAVIEAALRASFILSAPVDEIQRDATIVDHGRIIEAIEAGDSAAAAVAMRTVIENGLRRHGAVTAGLGLVHPEDTGRMKRKTVGMPHQ